MSENLTRPGQGGISSRPLHFIWIADCSGSMLTDGKIQSLNYAVREAIPAMQKAAEEHPEARVLVRAIKFSSGAQWVQTKPVSVDEYHWEDLTANEVTDMGKALSMVAEQLKMPPMDQRGLPPVLVLLTDGEPTDDFNAGLKDLMEQPWGQRAIRIAIAIGKDAKLDVLQKFIGNDERKPIQANNPDALVKAIKWSSTVIKSSAASRPIQADAGGNTNPNQSAVPIPEPPTFNDDDDVW